jgi:hypothetical protein
MKKQLLFLFLAFFYSDYARCAEANPQKNNIFHVLAFNNNLIKTLSWLTKERKDAMAQISHAPDLNKYVLASEEKNSLGLTPADYSAKCWIRLRQSGGSDNELEKSRCILNALQKQRSKIIQEINGQKMQEKRKLLQPTDIRKKNFAKKQRRASI